MAVCGFATASFAEDSNEPTYSYEVSSGSTPFKNSQANLNGITWTFNSNTSSPYFGAEWSRSNTTWRGIQFGKSNSACVPLSLTASTEGTVLNGKRITSITVDASAGEQNKVGLSISVNGVNYTCNDDTKVGLATTHAEYEFVGNEMAGDIVISYEQIASTATTKAVYLRSIKVYCSDADNPDEPKPCASPDFSATEAYVGDEITLRSATPNATITYTIGEETATGDSPLVIKFDEAGEYNVTAFASCEGFLDSESVSKKVTVIENPVVGGKERTVVFDFVNNLYGMKRLSGNTSEYNPKNTKFGDDWVIATANDRTRLWSDGIRIYSNGELTFQTPEGTVITAVTLYNNKGEDITNTYSSNLEFSEHNMTFTANWENGNNAIGKIGIKYLISDEIISAIAEDFKLSVDEHFNHSVIKNEDGSVGVSLSHAIYPHAKIFYKWTPKAVESGELYGDVLDGYSEHTVPFTTTMDGTMNYYAELNGHQTAVHSLDVKISDTTVISNINGVAEKTEWFNLQGQRISAPAHGLFIIQRGNKSIKVCR